MKKFYRHCRSFYKNIIIKRKFKTYWKYFMDQEYKSQIDHMYKITENVKHSQVMLVPTELLVHGHKVIYHEYAESLMKDDTLKLEPIRVFGHEGKYVVIDGNHRLPAILSRAERFDSEYTRCEVIW